jgi:hypothetical protein
MNARAGVGATLTVQHLMLNRNALFRCARGVVEDARQSDEERGSETETESREAANQAPAPRHS